MSGGYQTHEYSNGDIYMGEVSGLKHEGQGLYIWADRNSMHYGEWKNGDKHGDGLNISEINHERYPTVYYFETSERDLMYLGHQADRISNNKSIRLWRKSEKGLLRPLLGVYESDDQKIKIDLRKNYTGMLLDLKSASRESHREHFEPRLGYYYEGEDQIIFVIAHDYLKPSEYGSFYRFKKDSDGGVYYGPYQDDKRHGKGVLQAENYTHTGGFSHGEETGYGVLEFHAGGKYSGNFKNGKRDGNGTYVQSNQITYTGQWKDGKRHGSGEMTFGFNSLYEKYVGEFRDGLAVDGNMTLSSGESKRMKQILNKENEREFVDY